MTRRNQGVPADVVRARRLEIIDEHGVVRAVLAMNPSDAANDPEVVGLELRSRDGSQRAWLVNHDGFGPGLGFEIHGNQTLILRAMAPTPDRHGEVSIHLCDRAGATALSWSVSEGGDIIVEQRGPLWVQGETP